MRILLIVALAIGLFSCSKDDIDPNQLEGRWELVDCTFPVVNNVGIVILEFTSDRMKRFENDVLIFDLAYSKLEAEPANGSQTLIGLETGEDLVYNLIDGQLFIQEDSDDLILWELPVGCFYER